MEWKFSRKKEDKDELRPATVEEDLEDPKLDGVAIIEVLLVMEDKLLQTSLERSFVDIHQPSTESTLPSTTIEEVAHIAAQGTNYLALNAPPSDPTPPSSPNRGSFTLMLSFSIPLYLFLL